MRRMELKENRIVVKMPKRIHFVSYLIMGKLSHYCSFFIYKLETKIQLKFIDNSIKWCRLILIASKTWLFTMTCKIRIFLLKLVYVIIFWLKYVANCIVANHHLKLHIAKKLQKWFKCFNSIKWKTPVLYKIIFCNLNHKYLIAKFIYHF